MDKEIKDKQTVAKLKKDLLVAQRDLMKASAIFSSIGEGVIVTDAYSRIEQVNKLCMDILGYNKSDMLGQGFFKVIKEVKEDGSDVDPLDRPITRAFLTGQPISERGYYLTKSNVSIPVAVTVSPVMIDGVPTGAIEVFRDLSDEYVKEKIQSEFISLASHQLRTPLSSINTYAQMLSQGYAGKMNDRQATFVGVIESSASRMNELIHSLLNVTRMEAGNINVDIAVMNIDILCNEIIRSLRPSAKEKSISITYINHSNQSVESDPILVREVLSNLLSNAIKYTPKGGKIQLKVKMSERVVFSVKDNGYGIPAKARPYVFSKFYRAHNAVKNDVSGTGIGLYLAKQIAEQLEGDLWFSSEVGKGSTFNFSLPLVGSARKQGKFTLEMPA